MIRLLIFFLLLGCVPVSFKPKDAFNSVDPRFQPYVHAWQLNYEGDWPPGLEVKFGQPFDHNKNVGDCQSLAYNGKEYQYTIRIDENDWDKMRIHQREFTIFHELGHCVAIRPHFDETFELTIDGEAFTCPKSFMIFKLPEEKNLEKCRTELYKEMFGYDKAEDIYWPNYKQREPTSLKTIWQKLLGLLGI